jgi:hypothetical protein
MPAKKRPLLAVAISGSPAYNQPEKRRVTGAAVVSVAILPTGGSKLSTKICRLLPRWNITSRNLTLAEALGKACSTRRHNRCNIRDACKTSCAEVFLVCDRPLPEPRCCGFDEPHRAKSDNLEKIHTPACTHTTTGNPQKCVCCAAHVFGTQPTAPYFKAHTRQPHKP